MGNKSGIIIAAIVFLLAGLCSPCLSGTLEAIVKDDKGGPVKDAVIYAVPSDPSLARKSGEVRATIDQRDKEFIPNVIALAAGTAVNFPNHDNLRHHVYSFSDAKKFELPLYMGTPASPIVFDRPGVAVLGCNIHDWMSAYVFVADTPFYSTTDASGKAAINNLPPGEYALNVWHPRLKGGQTPSKRVKLSDAGASQAEFALSLARPLRPWRAPTGSKGGYR